MITKYRCLNNFFKYCKGTPEKNPEGTPISNISLIPGCKLDPDTCGYIADEPEKE